MLDRTLLKAAFALLIVALAACGAPPAASPTTPPAGEQATSAPAAVLPPPDPQPPSDKTGGIVRIGAAGAPDSLNPGVGYLAESYDIWEATYESLIHLNSRNQYVPWLATAWEASEDGKVWTLTLREDGKWHDGTALTAEDVAFTFEMIMSFEAFGYFKEYTTKFQQVEAVDPKTVKITLEGPVANMEERLFATYILPKHIWQQFEGDEEAALAFENVPLVGSGAFKLEEYKQGEFVRLVANKEHWAAPKIDEIIYRTYANPDAMVQALKTGEVDMITEVPPSTVPTLRNDPNISVVASPGRQLRDIIFNVIDPANCPEGSKCTGHPALRDLNVRKALAHATDKQQLIDAAFLGLAEPGLTLVTASAGEFYNRELQDYAFDPEQAKQLLESNGYTDSDGDGIRELPGDPSKPLRFRTFIPSDSLTGAREGELLASMWKAVGVQLDIQVLEPDTITSLCCPTYDYDVMIWGWYAGPDPSSLLSALLTREIDTGTSETGYSNPEFDALFEEQIVTVDKAKRKELLFKMQEIMLRDLPYIIPYYQNEIQAFRKDTFTGWVIPDGGVLYLQDRETMTNLRPL